MKTAGRTTYKRPVFFSSVAFSLWRFWPSAFFLPPSCFCLPFFVFKEKLMEYKSWLFVEIAFAFKLCQTETLKSKSLSSKQRLILHRSVLNFDFLQLIELLPPVAWTCMCSIIKTPFPNSGFAFQLPGTYLNNQQSTTNNKQPTTNKQQTTNNQNK